MSKEYKKIGGIALIALGVMMLFSMMGASLVRTRAYHGRMAMAAAAAEQVELETENTEIGASGGAGIGSRSWHGAHRHPGPGIGYARRVHSPFMLVGGLFRLLALGIIVYFILRYLKKRKLREPEPVAKVVHENEVETEIRVGDEINNDAAAIDPDELTADDLLQAMKRLGIKKLEL